MQLRANELAMLRCLMDRASVLGEMLALPDAHGADKQRSGSPVPVS